jgi:hypothetical protein
MLDRNEEGPEIHSVTTPPAAPGAMPQFATAEYAHIPSSERCAVCGNFLGGEYYRLQNRMICAACAARVQAGIPAESYTTFTRATLFGIGAAVVGLAGYAAFTMATHFYLGYLALGVGWLIAKAILKGSNGIGGRRYQILAVTLTYAAISLAEVPILLQRILQNPKIHLSLAVLLERIWPRLLWIGIASPFLNLRGGFSGAIGLFILFIGLRIAWTMTQARILPLDGPYAAA